jgi:hypothetical protein
LDLGGKFYAAGHGSISADHSRASSRFSVAVALYAAARCFFDWRVFAISNLRRGLFFRLRAIVSDYHSGWPIGNDREIEGEQCSIDVVSLARSFGTKNDFSGEA